MDYRDYLLDEMGYTICPISFPEYQHCDEKCEECATYIEFKLGLDKIDNTKVQK